MSTVISVNKQSVKQLLESGKFKPFVIPEYQRPYAWSDEQTEVLFDDLWNFTAANGETSQDGTYFLGSIVSYENDKNEQEIIDGQQRITSLFLLLRAIYTYLQSAETKTDKSLYFIKEIEPSIWRTEKLTGKVNYSDTLLTSKVINCEGNKILRDILATGKVIDGAKDSYSKNYVLFQTLFENSAKKNALMIYEFIYSLLNQAILLPITADNQDTALTIFSTLNDRGLPLSDADIFKANIYNGLSSEEKSHFIESWQELDEKATSVSENIQQLFYYYMFFLRACDGDSKTTTPGLRKYYSENKFNRLRDEFILQKLEKLLNIWIVVNNRIKIIDEPWSANKHILQVLDILTSYPNEYWKYPVVTFYLAHNGKVDFEANFLKFLRKLTTELLTKYLVMPTVNAVKTEILKLNVAIIKSEHPKFEFNGVNSQEYQNKIKNPHRNAVRMILKIIAYCEQSELLPTSWEIEHILPQKWQPNYFKIDEDVIKENLEHIGNKLPFEKRLNIIAGNGYFTKKIPLYLESTIAMTKAFASQENTDWTIDNIHERDIRISDQLIGLINKWDNSYTQKSEVDTQLSEE